MTSPRDEGTVAVCFVCLGNICRSPTAAGVMRHHVDQAGLTDVISVESAGTAGYHVGDLPDDRARAEARRRGVDIDDAAQQFTAADFARFDLVLAMDGDNLEDLLRLARRRPGGSSAGGAAESPAENTAEHKVRLLRDFDPGSAPGSFVPDPYYGGGDGFADVFDLVDAACRGLLEHLVHTYGLAEPGA